MNEPRKHDKVRSRNEAFAQRTATRIWDETPSKDNPYIAQSARCHGYDLVELMQKRRFVDVLFLLFRGELPSTSQAQLLEQLMIGLINPGPRHPATRAALNVGVGKTRGVHILPIASAVMGGDYLGGGLIESAIRFARKNSKREPQDLLDTISDIELTSASREAIDTYLPGFGSVHGGVDLLTDTIARRLVNLDAAGQSLRWAVNLGRQLHDSGLGLLPPGLAAAVFADLGFQPRTGGPLFQLFSAPGLIAHGLEIANKPITAMPYVSDEHYVIERPDQD